MNSIDNILCNYSCPLGQAELSEIQMDEAKRFVNFETDEQRIRDLGIYNRFVDGIIFDNANVEARLSRLQKIAALRCAAKKICGECIYIKK